MPTHISQRPPTSYSVSRLIRCCFLLLLASLLPASTLTAQNDKDTPVLELGKPIERELAGGQSHSYRIALVSGQYLHIIVEQRGIDVVLTLFGPDSKKITEIDSPNGTQGPEAVQLIADASGVHRLEVRSLEKSAALGRYEIKIEQLRPATDRDRNLIASRRAMSEAERLYAEGSAESLKRGMGKLKEALALFRVISDRAGEAEALNSLASISTDLGEYREALEYYNQALPLMRAVGDRDGEATALNGIAAAYYALGDTRRALDFYNQTLPLVKALGNRAAEGTLLGNIGDVYRGLYEYQKALSYLNQSVSIKREVGDRHGEAISLGIIGQVYYDSGEIRKGLDYCSQALTLAREIGDRRVEAYALTFVATGQAILGDSSKALGSLNQAVTIFKDVGDIRGLGVTLADIALSYSESGENQRALEYYDQVLQLERASGHLAGEAVSLSKIGGIYRELGEKQKALDKFSEALALARTISNRNVEAMVLNEMGLTYDTLGESPKALDFMNQALTIIRAVGDPREKAAMLHNIGLMYSDQGNHRKALAYLNEALALIRAAGDRNSEASMLGDTGLVLNKLGEYQKAADHLRQALQLSKSMGLRKEEGQAMLGLGSAYLKTGRVQEGFDYLDRALAIFRDIKHPSGEARVHTDVARFQRARGELDAARSQIESALGIFESSRTKIASRDLRASYFASVQEHYEFYIEVLMQLHKRRPSEGHDAAALQASERARARALLELLTEAKANIRQGVDPALLERERSLQRRLNATAQRQMRLPGGQGAGEQGESISREIEELTTELQQVEAQIKQTSPRYAALTQPTPLTLREIQTQVLDADTVLLEYSLGTDRSYLWAVTPTSITSYELPKREEIETAARRFYELITVSPRQAAIAAPEKRETGDVLQQQDGAQLKQAASQLSQVLLAPVAPLLGKKRLLIVSDGALQYIPFAALPAPTGGVSKAATTPLIVEHEIVNLPSASTLAVLRREAGGHQPAPKILAVLADPVFERNDERFRARVGKTEASDPRSNVSADEWLGRSVVAATSAKQSGVADVGPRIRRLLGTRREADEIVKLVSPTGYKKALDFAANRVTATSPDLGQYRYVHFATHGFLNSQHPELSGIVLSMFDEQGEPQDGFLRAHEVFNLKLNADVVVLSACRTGLGKEIRGEGLIGLTRGFMYAGSPRVVVSLWNVNDAATAELMTRFYRGMLVDKLRPVKALQAAQVSMLNEHRYRVPFYWAAFTLQGEWR